MQTGPWQRSRAHVVLALTLVVAAGWWSPPERPPHYLKIGRWNGRVVERSEDRVRYRFETPGEASALVELSRREPDHDPNYGTEAIAVEPAGGSEASPELLGGITSWLRGDTGRAQANDARAQVHADARADDSRAVATIWALGKTSLTLWALALMVAVGSAVLEWRGRGRAAGSRSRAWRTIAVAALIAVAVIGLRLGLAAPSPLDDDALRDVGAGLACALGSCPTGARASFAGLEHGTGFPRLIGLGLQIGLEVRGLQVVLWVLSGLAVAVTFDAGRRLGGLELGALAAAGELGLLLGELSTTGEILWNPASVALPAAVVVAALLRGAATGRTGPFLIAGLAAGSCFEAHVSGLALWPGLVIVTAATAGELRAKPKSDGPALVDRRLIWLPTLAGALAVPMLASPETVLTDARVIGGRLGVLGVSAGVAACLGLGLGLRRWLERAGPRWRPSVVALAAPSLTVLASLLIAGDLVESWPIRYFAATSPAIAIAGAWACVAGLRRIDGERARAVASAAIIGLVLVTSVHAYVRRAAVDRQRWTYADVDAIAEVLREHGVGRDEVHLVLRGFACGGESAGDRGQTFDQLLIAGLRMLGELDPGAPARDRPAPTWLVAKLANDDLPELPASAIALPSGRGHTIVLAPHEPVLDLAGARHCVRLASGAQRCVAATPRPLDLASHQILPRHEPAVTPGAGVEIVAIRYEIPLHSPAAPRDASVWIASTPRPWRFVDLSGPGARASPLPASEVELHLDPGARATLTLEREVEDGERLRGWWPPLIEAPADPGLRAPGLGLVGEVPRR